MRGKVVIISWLLLALVGCGSCAEDRTTADLQKVIGREMCVSSDFTSHVQDKDTLVNYQSDKVKLLVYYNFKGCSSCKLKELVSWDLLLTELDSIVDPSSYDPVFVFNVGRKEEKTKVDLIVYQFTRPVLFDREGEFEAANLLPEDPMFHTFLLDKEGKVRLVCSPIGNSKMWELYKQTIKILTTENWCSKGGFFGGDLAL